MLLTDLVFDLYGTLVDIHTEENAAVWEKTALYFGFHGASCTGEALRTSFEAAMRRREALAGQSYECYPDIPFEQVMAELLHERGIHDPDGTLAVGAAQLFRISSIEYIRLYPGAVRALDALRQAGFRLWLLSNAQAVFTAHELRLLGLGPKFDGVLLSSDYGCRKPDPRFFQTLLDDHGLSPVSCLMIGNDRTTDISGAAHVGMVTLYLHTGLTPADQAPAEPTLHPCCAPPGCRHFEFEGDDWQKLLPAILGLQNSVID